jgi:hypothetical protein
MTTSPRAQIEKALAAGPTPGNWTIGKAYTDDAGYVELPIHADINGKTATPAAVCLQFPRVPGMQDANAAFIVAACPANMRSVFSDHDAELKQKDELIAAERAKCEKFRDAMRAWKTEAEHQYGQLRLQRNPSETDYPVDGALDAYARGKYPAIAALTQTGAHS